MTVQAAIAPNTRVKWNGGMRDTEIQGIVISSVRSGGEYGFYLYEVAVDPVYFDRVYTAIHTVTEWNIKVA